MSKVDRILLIKIKVETILDKPLKLTMIQNLDKQQTTKQDIKSYTEFCKIKCI